MAGSSSVVLNRFEDSTINFDFSARQAAKVYVADLSAGTLRVLVKPFPSQTPILTFNGPSTDQGCTLSLTFPDQGKASLFIPVAFWASRTERQFAIEAFIVGVATTQRLGEQLFSITE